MEFFMDVDLFLALGGIILLPVMLITLEIGRRIGLRRLAEDPEGARAGVSAVEGAVFALFGLLIAFTFTSAASRYEGRRDLLVQHANAIGTAWLRLDLLPADVQSELRKDFRQYMDLVIKLSRLAGNPQDVDQGMVEVGKLQDNIWKLAETAAARDSRPFVATLVLPALNDMFDLGASRFAAGKYHISPVIIALLLFLSVLASLLAGYGMASSRRRNWLHMVIFAALVTLTLFVIIDLELPRHGLIGMEKFDQILIDLRQSMH
jgi:ABC-type glycerol-3-phosphate transport system permease component